eukprot:942077-Pleurochrysis_carterae.AAC.2
MKPEAASEGFEWVLVHGTGITDAQVRNKPTPTPVRHRRKGGRDGDDTMCTYDALRTVWIEREHTVAASERTFDRRGDIPFFTATQNGVLPLATKHSGALAK